MKHWMIVPAILYTFGCIMLGAVLTGMYKWLIRFGEKSIICLLMAKNQQLKAKLYDTLQHRDRDGEWR
jgi:hypothetical protein